MKKLLSFLLILLLSLSLTGCGLYNLFNTTTVTTKEWKTEGQVDIQSMVNEIYESVYSKVEAELYSSIYDQIIDEYSDGVIDLDRLQNLIYKAIEKCKKVNVGVSNLRSNINRELVTSATGSGVIYNKEELTSQDYLYRYYVITNEHVVDEGEAFKVSFEDETSYDATLISKEKTIDLALLYFDSNTTYETCPLGSSSDTKVGEIVLAIGNPKGDSLFGSVSLGIIGGKDRNLIENDGSINMINKYLQHDAAINAGNSGGGLFNLKGECIGINSVKYASSDIEGLNFAIPSDLVKDYIKQITETGEYIGTPKFGIETAAVSALTAQGRIEYNVPSDLTRGVVVINVTEGESCDGILLPKDIIIRADGIDVYTAQELGVVLGRHLIGDTISVTVIREGEAVTLEITFIRKTN